MESTFTDSIANFHLRNASDDELATALALCQREFAHWYGQAVCTASFPVDAQVGGIESVLVTRNRELLELGEATGIILPGDWKGTRTDVEIASSMAAQQLEMVEHSARIAAVVMLHSAYERSLWRYVRFAMVSHRDKAIERVRNRQVTIHDISECKREELIDRHLEKWWRELERETILKKWDSLVGLIGNPEKLRGDKWHFDRVMLEEFDNVRHDCVHDSGHKLKSFDLDDFAAQAERSHLVWLVEVTMPLNVQIPAEIALGAQSPTDNGA